MLALVTLSIAGVAKFLITIALLALMVVGLQWLFGKMGWSVPQPFWAILGFILFLLVVIWAFGGGSGITLG
jgi:type IV secretory pathway VirB2 component (pilin)